MIRLYRAALSLIIVPCNFFASLTWFLEHTLALIFLLNAQSYMPKTPIFNLEPQTGRDTGHESEVREQGFAKRRQDHCQRVQLSLARGVSLPVYGVI